MKNFIGRHKGNDDLERRLRRDRPEPRPEFLAMLSDRIESRPRHRRRVSLRVGLVGAVTAVMLVAMSAVGGLGYAAAAVQSVASAAKAVVVAPVVAAKAPVVAASKSDSKGSDNKGSDNKGSGGNSGGSSGGNSGGSSGGNDDKGGKGDDHEYGHHEKMCHKKGKDAETIDVDSNAVPAHLSQGDTRGECPKKK
jgi:uncharacterized membrane protein YgcG